ncbi:hypothetical protein DY000_02057042 [Brassica cretica]|uniref:Uncharacterized protein n=1 Tax=Brassica cretica TaxID=69181 RepID=A0ABQ7A952_BRACR|nr:hypothetical protein DY000_02057042 [Brassica cretica]
MRLLNPDLSLPPMTWLTIPSPLKTKKQGFTTRQDRSLHDPQNFQIRLERTLWRPFNKLCHFRSIGRKECEDQSRSSWLFDLAVRVQIGAMPKREKEAMSDAERESKKWSLLTRKDSYVGDDGVKRHWAMLREPTGDVFGRGATGDAD